jgi:hypothetical protein
LVFLGTPRVSRCGADCGVSPRIDVPRASSSFRAVLGGFGVILVSFRRAK